MPFDLSSLNEEQLKPVLDTEGAVLVTAGAGSGKTRLLTHRIAHLVVDLNVKPYNILAITFTNKAAREMKERLARMIDGAGGLKVSTIHSLCVTILRSFAHLIGFSADFSIYDEDERKKVIKRAANDIDANDEMLVERATAALNSIKNIGMDIDEYAAIHKYLPYIENIKKTMIGYTKLMRENNALDFDDLLIYAYEVVREQAQAREYYQNLFRYIHVDEFQDTNVIQYRLVKILAGKWGNVFVVGDEDQSIYGWRGADIANIKSFISDFNCRIYKLEQNYRSTKNIIKIANEVIKNNVSRIEKQLWTSNGDGDMPVIYNPDADSDEADYVMQTIKSLNRNGMNYSDIAVLMRINSLSRSIEQKFLFYGIPYKLYGGFKFYDRKEVKDVLAYLKAAVNPFDDEAAARIISFPKKGIGEASINKMLSLSRAYGLSLTQMILLLDDESIDERNLRQTLMYELSAALTKKLIPLSKKLKIVADNKNMKVSELLKLLYTLLELDDVFSDGSEESESRLMNIGELISSVVQTEQSNPDMTLSTYVQQIMLYSEGDDSNGSDSVNVATIHSAKGLEYKAVFIIGLEEKIFPLSRSFDSVEGMEEERRLMYVALTRAKQRLYLTYTRKRFLYGKHAPSVPSRFLFETGLIKKQERTDFEAYGGYQNSYGNYGGYNSYNSSGNYGGYNKDNNNYSGYNSYNKPKPAINPATNIENLGKPIKGTISIEQLKIGQRISHKRLGEGTVETINTANNEADIAFDSVGTVTLAVNLAPITILD